MRSCADGTRMQGTRQDVTETSTDTWEWDLTIE